MTGAAKYATRKAIIVRMVMHSVEKGLMVTANLIILKSVKKSLRGLRAFYEFEMLVIITNCTVPIVTYQLVS